MVDSYGPTAPSISSRLVRVSMSPGELVDKITILELKAERIADAVKVANVNEVPAEGGIAIKYGPAQIALFNFASRGEWYASQNQCPHMSDMVPARGLIGDEKGQPKVACPQHKKTFSLKTGECLSGDQLKVRTFPVKIDGDGVYLELPSEAEIEKLMPIKARCDLHEDAASAAE